MVDSDNTKDAIALEGLAELAEGVMLELPAGDRPVWIQAVLRARRVALEMRAGVDRRPPARGGPTCSLN